MITLVVMTHGRYKYLEQTIDSLETLLCSKVDRKVIHSDSQDEEFNFYLDQYEDFDIIVNEKNRGFSGAIRNVWDQIDSDYILHWEDDFLLNEYLDVDKLRWILMTSPELAQIALKRQPWNDQEIQAGGIVECDPDSFKEITRYGYTITRHNKFFTTNPCLYPRSTVELGWPDGDQSEGMFTFKMRKHGLYSAFLDGKFDPPLVEHIGYDRAGGINY